MSLQACSAGRCGAPVRREQRWCPTHRPRMEAGPRTLIHRIAVMILHDPSLSNRAIGERTGAPKQKIVLARKVIGVPQPEECPDMRADLDRCIPIARKMAEATVRRIQ